MSEGAQTKNIILALHQRRVDKRKQARVDFKKMLNIVDKPKKQKTKVINMRVTDFKMSSSPRNDLSQMSS